MVHGKEISLEDRVAMKTLREAGYSFDEIGNKIGCSKSAAYEVFKNFKHTDTVAVRKRTGQPKIFSERDECGPENSARKKLFFSHLRSLWLI